jgi:hypothetical protein
MAQREEPEAMPAPITNDPLLALDAVVFDTETTGLDPGQARLLQIGAATAHAQLDSVAADAVAWLDGTDLPGDPYEDDALAETIALRWHCSRCVVDAVLEHLRPFYEPLMAHAARCDKATP